jgi:hypothetical protein
MLALGIATAAVCAIAPAAAPAKTTACSVSGLTPALAHLTALGGVSCATARSLPGPALRAAKLHGFNRQAVKVHGYTCNVLGTKAHLVGGHCTQDSHRAHVVDWRYA